MQEKLLRLMNGKDVEDLKLVEMQDALDALSRRARGGGGEQAEPAGVQEVRLAVSRLLGALNGESLDDDPPHLGG